MTGATVPRLQLTPQLEPGPLELGGCLEQRAPWETVDAGGFRCTALPAVDGLGGPQVSWAVEADARGRV